MKTPTSILLLILVTLASVHADESRLQIKLLKIAGATPNEATLRALVEDPGAQAAVMISKTFAESGGANLSDESQYRYPCEFSAQGVPAAYETRVLGWSGKATATSLDQNKLNLTLDLTNVRIGTPVVYETEGVQVTMPVFTSVKATDQKLVVTRGQWTFLRAASENETLFWAVRVDQ